MACIHYAKRSTLNFMPQETARDIYVHRSSLRNPFLNVTQCYGINTHLLEIECQNHNEEVVLNSLKLGSKQLQTNCTESKSDTNFCCQWDSENDCYFDYGQPLTATDEKFRKCHGKSQCWFIVDWALNIDKCPTSRFGMTTQYMTAEYLCAKKNDIMEVCSPTGPEIISRQGKPIYLKSPGYPYLKKGACRCNIQTTGLVNHRIELKALNAEINYPQSLFVFDESDTTNYPMKNITYEMNLKGLDTIYVADGTKPGISLWYLPQREFAFYFVVNSSIETTIKVSCSPFKRAELYSKIERSRYQLIQTSKNLSNFAMLFNIDFVKILVPILVLLLIAVMIIILIVYRWKRKRKHNIKKVAPKAHSSDENIYDNAKQVPDDVESVNDTTQFCSKTCQTDFDSLSEIDKKTPSSANNEADMNKSTELSTSDNGCVNKAFESANDTGSGDAAITVESRTES
eukprot:XP_014776080.1 PREDICTED: uncharacterized protein LOC106873288 [Octopus bimaculoides]